MQTEEGRILNPTGTPNYEYTLTDHLGNSRVTFDSSHGSSSAQQVDDYYPFGLIASEPATSSPRNHYLYNKKELQDELTQYDYGARFYDPIVGRWTSVDPLAEKSRRWSPYNYGVNDPIRMTDPDGMEATDWVKRGSKYVYDDRVKDQKTATQFEGKDAKYIGKSADVYSKFTASEGSGKTYTDKVHLGSDGSVSKSTNISGYSTWEGQGTLKAGDKGTLTNFNGSEFYARQTTGAFIGVSGAFAMGGGFGIAAGFVTDATGQTKPYLTVSGTNRIWGRRRSRCRGNKTNQWWAAVL